MANIDDGADPALAPLKNLNMALKRAPRPDSPNTIRACQLLGVTPEELIPKPADSFQETFADPDIVSVRYNHYLKRYQNTLREVTKKRKELLKAQRQRHQISGGHPHHQSSPSLPGHGSYNPAQGEGNMSHRPTAQPLADLKKKSMFLGSPTGENGKLQPIFLTMGNDPKHDTYQRAVSYMKNAHSTNSVKMPTEILPEDLVETQDTELRSFENLVSSEIIKFNKFKRAKQRQAKEFYDLEMKKVQMVEELKEREQRRLEFQKIMQEKKAKEDEKKKQIFQMRLENVMETEKRREHLRMQEKRKMQERLESKKRKLEEEYKARTEMLHQQQEKLEKAKKRADEKRLEVQENEIRYVESLNFALSSKLAETQEKLEYQKLEKKRKLQEEIKKIDEQVNQIKDYQKTVEEQKLQSLVERLVEKEENIRASMEKSELEKKKKQDMLKQRNSRLVENKKDIDHLTKEKIKSIVQRFEKVQENIQAKKEREQKIISIKQEESKLKLLDKQENRQRKLRQLEYEHLQFLEKEREREEKRYRIKENHDLIKKMKLESSMQSKFETERIDENITNLGKNLYEHSSSKITTNQMKILRDIFNPEDYREVSREAKRQRELQQAIEEQKLKEGDKGLSQTVR